MRLSGRAAGGGAVRWMVTIEGGKTARTPDAPARRAPVMEQQQSVPVPTPLIVFFQPRRGFDAKLLSSRTGAYVVSSMILTAPCMSWLCSNDTSSLSQSKERGYVIREWEWGWKRRRKWRTEEHVWSRDGCPRCCCRGHTCTSILCQGAVPPYAEYKGWHG